MPHFSDHPSCCGITIFHEFGDYGSYESYDDEEIVVKFCSKPPLAEYVTAFKNRMTQVSNEIVYEITLIDEQMEGWWPILKKYGFRRVVRFRNVNSGNYVTILHYYRTEISDNYQVFDPTHDAETLAPMRVSA